MKILIVDDDPVMQIALKKMTTSRGYDVTVSGDAESALALCQDERYPLLIIDWVLKDMDGLELCRQIRALPDGDTSVIMAVTGRTEDEDLRAVLDAGFDDYLPKPIDRKLFNIRLTIAEERLAEIAKRKEAEQQLTYAYEQLQHANEKLKANQVHLVQSEKMASLGQMAAGVAHEINNPVGFVTSNLGTLAEYTGVFKRLIEDYETLTDQVTPDQNTAEVLHRIAEMRQEEDLDFIREDIDALLTESLNGMNRVKEIVQGLKSFAHIDEAEMQIADINEGIEATLRVVWNELKYKCKVNTKLKPLPKIRCYPGQLNQVFMNLLVNAAHAMEDRGEITIETEATESKIIIRISDNGVGIPEEHLSKLFNPFFTTKPVGEGTGLGLSISYGIIQKHGGSIEVDSEVGRGTTFTIYLPIEEDHHA